MTNKKVWYGVALVVFFLGIALFMIGSAPAGNQEVAQIQKAIAAEKLEWQAGVTSLTALSPEERRMRLGGRLSEIPAVGIAERHEPGELPATLDWRNNGGNWITSVKDQGNCGSCWAFATTALLEAMVKISKHITTDTDLSEQMLVSCSGAGNCAYGGYEYKAAQYIKTTGIPPESCFPYTATDSSCHPCSGWASKVVRITSWGWVGSSTSAVESALQAGPVTSWMAVYSDLYHYTSGIYQPTAGATYEGGHFVVIVGYNHAQRYWICKNSWGKNWGESGFFRIRFGAASIGGQVLRMIKPIVNNSAPVLQNIANCSGEEGQPIDFIVRATDSDGDTLTYTADNLPTGASLDAGSGAFSWTPSFTQAGTYTIRFRVTDGIADDTQNVILTVTNVKHVQW
jgi:C1A family cysteine protease